MLCMEVGEKLALAREYHSPALKQRDLAKLLRVDTSTVGRWEADNHIPPTRLTAIATLLNVTEEWFFDKKDTPPSAARRRAIDNDASPLTSPQPVGASGGYAEIKYAGVVPASTWGDPLQVQDTRMIDKRYYSDNRFLTTVVGDSCEPSLVSGDVTLWEVQRGGQPHGLIVIAEREEDHACTVKQYKHERGRDRLIPINPEFEEPTATNGFHIAAFLVGVFRTEGIERSWYFPGGLRPEHFRDLQPQLPMYQKVLKPSEPALRVAEKRRKLR